MQLRDRLTFMLGALLIDCLSKTSEEKKNRNECNKSIFLLCLLLYVRVVFFFATPVFGQ